MHFFDIDKHVHSTLFLLKEIPQFTNNIHDVILKDTIESIMVYKIKTHINSCRDKYLIKNNIQMDVSSNKLPLFDQAACNTLDDIIHMSSYSSEVQAVLDEVFTETTWCIWTLDKLDYGYIMTNLGDYRIHMFEKHCKNKLW